MKLTSRQLYDYRDPTWQEVMLVRAGHHIWSLIRKLRAGKGDTDKERQALYAALETIWQAKREVKAELKRKRSEAFQRQFAPRLQKLSQK